MDQVQQPAKVAFALGLIGLGILTLIFHDFALVWQPVPLSLPARIAFAYASGAILLLGDIGLLFRASAAWSSRLLFPYLFVWLLLKVPALVVAPKLEAVWLNFGEIAVLFAAGWILFATLGQIPPSSPLAFLAGRRAMRVATLLFGLSLLPIGLSHILYTKQTVELIPAWLPLHAALAYATGAAQMLCGVCVLLSVFARAAALVEAGMVATFALFVWLPQIFAAPNGRLPWTAFFITWFFAASAWVVAQNIPAHGLRDTV